MKIIAICETQENADILEKVFIKVYREMGKAEYNICDGGNGVLCSGEFEIQRRLKIGKKISESLTGKKRNEPAWNKNKQTGFHWYNNGIENILSRECPKGFVKGRLVLDKEIERLKTQNIGRTHIVSEETRKKISDYMIGKKMVVVDGKRTWQ